MSGQALKEAGIVTALDNPITPPWKARARQAIIDLALDAREFTSEDVRRLAGDPPTDNVMGAMLNVAARRGVIRRVRYQTADRPTAHARVISVWTAGASAAQALTAWPTTGSEGLMDSPGSVVSPLRGEWEHKGCGSFATPPGEATIDPRWRVGACPACHQKDAVFTRREGAA